MSDVLQKLNEYKGNLSNFKQMAEETKTKRIRNESRLETLKSSQDSIIEKIVALGYKPEELELVIGTKLKELEVISAKLEAAMPDENGIIDPKAIEALVGKPEVVDESNNVEETKTIEKKKATANTRGARSKVVVDDTNIDDIDLTDMEF